MLQATKKLNLSVQTLKAVDVFSIIGASFFIALCAQVEIPLFFTPVPLTLQTLSVLLVGATLGSKKGALALGAYFIEALCGWPILAGGAAGFTALLGAHGGYLLGFAVQAYLTGLYFENSKHDRSYGKTLFALISICMLQLIMGSLWLAAYVGWKNAFVMGMYPFIPGEIFKSLAVVSYFRSK